jgi:hypothetical protein
MVEVDGQPLPPRYDLRDYRWVSRTHGPASMFAWGDASPKSAQLALALLADCWGDDSTALKLHATFCLRFIERLPQSRWRLLEERLRTMIAELE